MIYVFTDRYDFLAEERISYVINATAISFYAVQKAIVIQNRARTDIISIIRVLCFLLIIRFSHRITDFILRKIIRTRHDGRYHVNKLFLCYVQCNFKAKRFTSLCFLRREKWLEQDVGDTQIIDRFYIFCVNITYMITIYYCLQNKFLK